MVSLPSSTPAPSYSAVSSSSDLKVPSSFAALDHGMLRAVGMCPARWDCSCGRCAGANSLPENSSGDRTSIKFCSPMAAITSSRKARMSVRAGHIPTARNIPWSKAANDDGTFKSDDELTALYEGAGVELGKDTIAYCRIGERSAQTWFVLHELLGQPNVKNYDGSWTEYGSLSAYRWR